MVFTICMYVEYEGDSYTYYRDTDYKNRYIIVSYVFR